MKCEFCGEEISPGALACPRCGGPVSRPVTQQSAAEAPKRGEAQGVPLAQAAPVQGMPPAQQAPPAMPPDPPLAKLEEDFIALAEETVAFDEGKAVPSVPPDTSAVPGTTPPALDAAGHPMPPGAHLTTEQNAKQNENLIGGYKGPETSSVAGAGVQTADDPFGLNITEKAPPVAGKERHVYARSWRYSRWWNITVMIVGIVLLLGGLGVGVYFGFLRKGGPSAGAPIDALRQYCEEVIAGDTTNLAKVATPDSQFSNDLNALLAPYRTAGITVMAGFGANTVQISKDSATVDLTKLDVELQDEKGNKQVISLLDITQPYKLPTQVTVLQQNGSWLVQNPVSGSAQPPAANPSTP